MRVRKLFLLQAQAKHRNMPLPRYLMPVSVSVQWRVETMRHPKTMHKCNPKRALWQSFHPSLLLQRHPLQLHRNVGGKPHPQTWISSSFAYVVYLAYWSSVAFSNGSRHSCKVGACFDNVTRMYALPIKMAAVAIPKSNAACLLLLRVATHIHCCQVDSNRLERVHCPHGILLPSIIIIAHRRTSSLLSINPAVQVPEKLPHKRRKLIPHNGFTRPPHE